MLLIACNLFIGTFDKSAGILNVSLTNKEDSLLLESDVLKSFTPKLAKLLYKSYKFCMIYTNCNNWSYPYKLVPFNL